MRPACIAALVAFTLILGSASQPAWPDFHGNMLKMGIGIIQQQQRQIEQQRHQKWHRQSRQQQSKRHQPEQSASALETREAQSALNALGFDAGPVDGVSGSRTRAALAAFEHAYGFPADGRLDPEVLGALRFAVRRLEEGDPPLGASTAQDENRGPPDSASAVNFATLDGYDLPLGDYRTGVQDPDLADISHSECRAACAGDPRCLAYTYNVAYSVCMLKDEVSTAAPVDVAVSGIKAGAAPAKAPEPTGARANVPPRPTSDGTPELVAEAESTDQGPASSRKVTGGLVAPALPPARQYQAAERPVSPEPGGIGLHANPLAPVGLVPGMTFAEARAVMAATNLRPGGARRWTGTRQGGKIEVKLQNHDCSGDCDIEPVHAFEYAQSDLFIADSAYDVAAMLREATGAKPTCSIASETYIDCVYQNVPEAPNVDRVVSTFAARGQELRITLWVTDDPEPVAIGDRGPASGEVAEQIADKTARVDRPTSGEVPGSTEAPQQTFVAPASQGLPTVRNDSIGPGEKTEASSDPEARTADTGGSGDGASPPADRTGHWWEAALAEERAAAKSFRPGPDIYKSFSSHRHLLNRDTRIVHKECTRNEHAPQSSMQYFDCGCLMKEFAKDRIARAEAVGWEDLDNSAVIGMADRHLDKCPSEPGAASVEYSRCMNWNKSKPPGRVENYCTCVANVYSAAHVQNSEFYGGQMSAPFASQECNRRGIPSP